MTPPMRPAYRRPVKPCARRPIPLGRPWTRCAKAPRVLTKPPATQASPDPAVIGLIELAGTDRVLLARDARRDFFSLVAGYVEPGESLEHAFAREVAEETGRTCRDIRYAGSQPWPISDSVMIGFTAVTDDADARWGTDGELAEIIWAGPADILDGAVPIAPPGSIAHRLIIGWARARAAATTTNIEH